MTEPSQPEIESADEEFGDIRGQVVDFLSNREIIMSIGKADGVEIGMRFVVLGLTPVEITVGDEVVTEDVEVAKSVVKVVRFSGEHLSIGRTFRTIKGRPAYEYENPTYIGPKGLGGLGANLTQSTIKVPGIPDRTETFDVEPKETVRGRTDMKVQKGDVVRLTVGDEFL